MSHDVFISPDEKCLKMTFNFFFQRECGGHNISALLIFVSAVYARKRISF